MKRYSLSGVAALSGLSSSAVPFVLGVVAAASSGCFGLVETTSGHGVNVAGGSSIAEASGGSTMSGDAAAPNENGARPGSAAGAELSGLPCEIDEILATHCRGCNGGPLTAPMPLLAYADLVAPAASDPNRLVAELALARMHSETAPMPPAGLHAYPPNNATFSRPGWRAERLEASAE